MPKLPIKPWWRSDRDAWFVTYKGKQRQLARGKNNKAEANKALAKLLSEKKPRVVGDLTSVRGMLDMWLERGRQVNRPSTNGRHEWTANSFALFIGDEFPASHVTENHIAGWVASRNWQRGTKVQNLNTIRAAFNYAVRQGLLDKNPCLGLSYGQAPPRIHMMTREQSEAALRFAEEHMSPRFYELIRVLHATGMRPSEAARLETAWLSDDFSVATIRVHKTSKVSTKPRKVYFPATIQPLIRELARRSPRGPLILCSTGRAWAPNNAGVRMRRVRKALGFGPECCLESFRHQWITDALENGVPIATVAELSGNSVAIISRHYSKLASRTQHLGSAVDSVRPACT